MADTGGADTGGAGTGGAGRSGRSGQETPYEGYEQYERYGPGGSDERYGPGEAYRPYRRYEPRWDEEQPGAPGGGATRAEAPATAVPPPADPSPQSRPHPYPYPYPFPHSSSSPYTHPYRQPPGEPDQLRDQLRQLLRYRTVLVVCLLLGLLAGGWFGVVASGSYAASSEVTLRQATVDPFAAGGKPADSGISIASERQTAQGSTVAGLAARRLEREGGGQGKGEGKAESKGAIGGAHPDTRLQHGLQRGLQVTNPPDTLILRFTYTAATPAQAAARANAFARAFLDNRKRQTDAQVAKMLDRYRAQAAPLRSRHAGNDTSAAQLSALDSKIADLAALDTTPGTVVRTAIPPDSPAGPGLPLLLGLGAAAGLLLGLLAAWLRLVFDPRARSDAEVVRALDAPVLGTLPRGRGGTLPAGGREAEEYRSVAFRIACDPLLAHRPQSVLVVAARGSGDTAAAVAVNLAAAFVEMDDQVLLVEADLRHPSLTERLRSADGVRSSDAARTGHRGDAGHAGFSGTGAGPRAGGRSAGAAAVGWPAGPRLSVDVADSGTFDLVQGTRVRNVARALRSAPASQLLARALDSGTRLVAYAPAVLSCADAVALCDRVGGVLLVCDPREVRRADLERVRELVGGSGGTVVGALLHHRRPGEAREARRARRIAEREGTGTGPGSGPGPGNGLGAGSGLGPGNGLGTGNGLGPGNGLGTGNGPVSGRTGADSGTARGTGAGTGQGTGSGFGTDTGSGSALRRGPGPSWRLGEDAYPANPAPGPGPGTGGGDGAGAGQGPGGGQGPSPGAGQAPGPGFRGHPLDADPEGYGGRAHRR